MSNKTQLQTNNTKLASLIETLQGKAAGGGGGDSTDGTPSYETCEVELIPGSKTGANTIALVYCTLVDGAPKMRTLYCPADAALPTLPDIENPLQCIVGSELCLGYPNTTAVTWLHEINGSIVCSDGTDTTQVGMKVGKIFKINGPGSITYNT